MSLIGRLRGNGPSGYGYGSTAEDVTQGLDLRGQNILITGCNSGLGLETARVLSLRGARVLGAARTVDKARAALSGLPGEAVPLACELAEPDSIRACAKDVRALGIELSAIVCNAGIMAPPKLLRAHGYELQFFTNHIGHFVLVNELLGTLTATGRVVSVSSIAHRAAPRGGIQFDNLSGERGYGPWTAYGQSKLANILFAKQLARRFAGTQKTANAIHPGVIGTGLARQSRLTELGYALMSPALKSIPEGAATQTYVAVHPAAANVTGEFFANSNVTQPRADANDVALAERLWTESEKIAASL
ncbi:MAG TPA: SDR family oxidoreductase [Polyangiaceae bacterium]|nr:SDR family oxidoreductase [Polyangiaceae bacterium]